ncbi:MAG: hypothetical protein WBK55_09695 [Alphaproteobacteria bacterium]
MQLKRNLAKQRDAKKEISDEIFKALGNRKKFSPDQKRKFSNIVAAELPYWLRIAELNSVTCSTRLRPACQAPACFPC